MQSKELFLRDKELSAKWAAIVNGEVFPRVLPHLRSEFMQMGPSREATMAVEMFIHLLETLSSIDDQPFEFPSPGLWHQVDQLQKKDKE